MATIESEQSSQPLVHPQIILPKATLPKLSKKAIPRPPISKTPQTTGTPPTIYFIRHGEKNDPDPVTGKVPDGLNALGLARANALPLVFNDEGRNPYDIRLILAMQPQATGDQERPYETIWPLFLSLSQGQDNYCLLDNTVHEEAVHLAARRIQEYIASGSPGNILVCWEHKNLTNILQAFGFDPAPEYPKFFDVVWVLKPTPKLDSSGVQITQAPGQSTASSQSATTQDFNLNPDDDKTKEKQLWTWNTITWWSEGTTTDALLDDDAKKWLKKEKAPATIEDDEITTLSKNPDAGPTFAWAPYKHHQLDHPKPDKVKDSKADKD